MRERERERENDDVPLLEEVVVVVASAATFSLHRFFLQFTNRPESKKRLAIEVRLGEVN